MADQLKRIADKLDGGDPNVGKPTEEGNLKRIADYIVENGMGGGGSGGLFIVDITEIYDETTHETTFSASKTYAEINEALTNENTICARYVSSTYKPMMYLTAKNDYSHHFDFNMTVFVGNVTDGYFIEGYNARITSDNVVTYEYVEKAFYE